MWRSAVPVPGRPTLLVVDASRNLHGWEAEFCRRFFTTLVRRKLRCNGDGPACVDRPEALGPHLEPEDAFNCLLLFCHSRGEGVPPETSLSGYWRWLNNVPGLGPKLFAACTWEEHDPEASQEVLQGPSAFAPFVLAPLSPLSVQEAGLYFLKLFVELELHCPEAITAKMVWFSHVKAAELLKRRELPGRMGVRC